MEELKRLQRNDKRTGPRKGKAKTGQAGSPDPAASPADSGANAGEEGGNASSPATKGRKNQTGQTKRKCAACGQVGHIKTNRGYICFTCDFMSTPLHSLNQ